MRTMTFNHDGCDGVAVVSAMLMALPVGHHGIKFDRQGDRYTAVDRVKYGRGDDEFTWKVSFRPVGDDPERTRYYGSPVAAARAIVAGGHDDFYRVRRLRAAAKVRGYRLHFDGELYSLHSAAEDLYGLTIAEAEAHVMQSEPEV